MNPSPIGLDALAALEQLKKSIGALIPTKLPVPDGVRMIQGPYYSSRRMRRAGGMRGYGSDRVAMAPSLRTRRRG